MPNPDFIGFPKIARYSRECIVTEKIDGTNAQIWIPGPDDFINERVKPQDFVDTPGFLVGSRTRWITPAQDNMGFARWAYEHAEELLQLGPGHHFGEWWGQGIQRNYGLKERRFSLFNVGRWSDPEVRPTCCSVVPILGEMPFDLFDPTTFMTLLSTNGSFAAPGYMKPEGIVIHHCQGGMSFKKTFEKDETGKEQAPV